MINIIRYGTTSIRSHFGFVSCWVRVLVMISPWESKYYIIIKSNVIKLKNYIEEDYVMIIIYILFEGKLIIEVGEIYIYILRQKFFIFLVKKLLY